MPSPVSAVSGMRASDISSSFAASPMVDAAVVDANDAERLSSLLSVMLVSHSQWLPLRFNLMLPSVVPLPSGVIRLPSLALIAFHALPDAA